MKRIAPLLLLAVLTIFPSLSMANEPIGTFTWVHQAGSNMRDAGQAMCGLPDGSFFVQGWFEDSFDVTLGYNPHAFGLRDIFLAKYSPQGNLLWVQTAGSGHCDQGGAIDALPDGTCVMAASYGYGTRAITIGFGTPNATVLSPVGNYDICIAKYGPDGNLIWARSAASYDFDFADTIAMSPDGGVYVAGIFYGDTMYFDKGLETQATVPEFTAGTGGSYFAHYDTNGAFQWAKAANVSKVITLSDNSCIALQSTGLVRYAADGTEVWRDDTLAGNGGTLQAMGPMEFVVAYALSGGNGSRVTRYRVETNHTLTALWSLNLPYVVYNGFPITARPDGSLVLVSSTDQYNTYAIWSISADGTAADYGLTGYCPKGLFAVAGEASCFAVTNFYSDMTVAGQTLTHRGSGDYFIGKFRTRERCQVLTRCDGPFGWLSSGGAGPWYWKGDQATLTASPALSGVSEFVGWGGDFEGQTEPTLTFTVDSDKEAVAIFELLEGVSLPATSTGALLALVSLLGITALKRARR